MSIFQARGISIFYHIYSVSVVFEIGSSPSLLKIWITSRSIIWTWCSSLPIVLCFPVFIFVCVFDFFRYLGIQSFSKCSLRIYYMLSTSSIGHTSVRKIEIPTFTFWLSGKPQSFNTAGFRTISSFCCLLESVIILFYNMVFEHDILPRL